VTAVIVGSAIEMAGRVRDADGLRPFKHAVREFVHALGAVPDEGAGTLSTADVRVLQTLAENVIDSIETRVPDIASAADAQMLVNSVYEIRRLLEDVTHWRRHYAIARHV
jgi:hypothetical protein